MKALNFSPFSRSGTITPSQVRSNKRNILANPPHACLRIIHPYQDAAHAVTARCGVHERQHAFAVEPNLLRAGLLDFLHDLAGSVRDVLRIHISSYITFLRRNQAYIVPGLLLRNIRLILKDSM